MPKKGYKQTKKEKKERIAGSFLLVSQILFFMAVLLNYLTDTLFPKGVFIGVAGFLLAVSIITFIIKIIVKKGKND